MADVNYLGNGAPDGNCFGKTATELISFYGKAPKAQNAHIADATDAATAITTLNAVILALENYGLFATS